MATVDEERAEGEENMATVDEERAEWEEERTEGKENMATVDEERAEGEEERKLFLKHWTLFAVVEIGSTPNLPPQRR